MATCDPCEGGSTLAAASIVLPTCSDMMARAVLAYSAVFDSMAGGKSSVDVSFGDQRIHYEANDATLKSLLGHIARLHRSCPTASSAAILGLGGGGSLSVRTGGCGPVSGC
jgi:hypothetical protein